MMQILSLPQGDFSDISDEEIIKALSKLLTSQKESFQITQHHYWTTLKTMHLQLQLIESHDCNLEPF